MTLLMVAFGLLWGQLLQIRATQSVFIATCLSLSSTPLVSRFLAGSARGDKEGRCNLTFEWCIPISTLIVNISHMYEKRDSFSSPFMENEKKKSLCK